MEEKTIKMVFESVADSPVKSLCMMADGVHVCAGSFDGSVFMWDIQVHTRVVTCAKKLQMLIILQNFQKVEVTMPEQVKKQNIQYILDTDGFLWCCIERSTRAILVIFHLIFIFILIFPNCRVTLISNLSYGIRDKTAMHTTAPTTTSRSTTE
jgi:hypothetical protein